MRMKNKPHVKSAQLVEGAIGKTLTRLTIPMIFGIMSMMLFNLIDTFFISRLGTTELAAISFTFPVVFLLGSLALGLGIGASSVISRAIGEGDLHKVQRLTTDSITLSFLIVVVLSSAGMLTIDPVFRLMGATPDILPLIRQYMTIWYVGMAFVVIPMVGNNAIRATGDMITPSVIMIIGGGINALLDPMLIFGIGFFPRLEIKGAAIATVISRAITLVAAIWILTRREKMLTFVRFRMRESVRSWKKILFIGVPAAGTNMLVPLSAGIITRMISKYGPEGVAAFGVGSRIEPLALFVIMALASALAPFIGQNWGAGKHDRVREGLRLSIRFALLWEFALAVILILFARPMAGLFSDQTDVVSIIVDFIWIFSLSYGFQGVFMLVGISLNAINKPIQSAVLSVIRLFALYIPLALFGSYLFGIKGIFIGGGVANVMTGILAYVWGRSIFAFRTVKANS